MAALAAAVDEPLLSEQVRTAVIDAVCRCGCSSVRLRSDQPAIPAARVARLSEQGRDDLFCVQAFSSHPAHELVYVELHVVRGRVEELEVYDSAGGDGVAVALTQITEPGREADLPADSWTTRCGTVPRARSWRRTVLHRVPVPAPRAGEARPRPRSGSGRAVGHQAAPHKPAVHEPTSNERALRVTARQASHRVRDLGRALPCADGPASRQSPHL